MPLTPKNRKEEWLQGLVDHETTLTPKNRPEEWMKEIIDASGGGGGGIDLGITGASAGEYAKIKTVDADGVPTAWESGSGGGGALVEIGVTSENGTLTLQKTLQEILDYIESGLIPYINHDPSEGLTVGDFLLTLFKSAGADSSSPGTIDGYFINFGDLYFECASLNDYPVGS